MIRKALLYAFVILALYIAVLVIGAVGSWAADTVSVEVLFALPLLIAIALFVLGKVIFDRISKVERLKTDFLTVVAHRLRTPLSRMNWMLDELSSDMSAPPRKETVDAMRETLNTLVDVVNQFLDATEAGKTSLYYDYLFEREKPDHILRQVVADYTVGAARKGVSLNLSIEEGIPQILLDRDRIKLAMSIFIENAILYTSKGGRVDVSLKVEGNEVVFTVKDTGIGISQESLRYVFTKFFRTKDAVSVDRDRTGLGLFIAKEIVEQHGGTVGVSSEGAGKGSTFWFTLPVR